MRETLRLWVWTDDRRWEMKRSVRLSVKVMDTAFHRFTITWQLTRTTGSSPPQGMHSNRLTNTPVMWNAHNTRASRNTIPKSATIHLWRGRAVFTREQKQRSVCLCESLPTGKSVVGHQEALIFGFLALWLSPAESLGKCWLTRTSAVSANIPSFFLENESAESLKLQMLLLSICFLPDALHCWVIPQCRCKKSVAL